MNMNRALGLIALLSGMLAAFATAHAAEQNVGKIVALRGAATINRGTTKIAAQVKSGILASDTVKTAVTGRAKLLFIDDSVLTLGENSTLVVEEFVHAKGKEGRSIYNLLDGKMRSVVGRTKFEVRTPTAVAAARGTVIFFEVGKSKNQNYSRVICLEGKVEVKSISPGVKGMTLLTPGTVVVVRAGEAPPPAAKASPAELNRARQATASARQGRESSGDAGPAGTPNANDREAVAGQDQERVLEGWTVDPEAGLATPPNISATTTAGSGVTPPFQAQQPILLPPTRVNIIIDIANPTAH
jgi:hypothetical protein